MADNNVMDDDEGNLVEEQDNPREEGEGEAAHGQENDENGQDDDSDRDEEDAIEECPLGPNDPRRMKLSAQERQWALAIKMIARSLVIIFFPEMVARVPQSLKSRRVSGSGIKPCPLA